MEETVCLFRKVGGKRTYEDRLSDRLTCAGALDSVPSHTHQATWPITVTPALRRWKQEHQAFKDPLELHKELENSLCYTTPVSTTTKKRPQKDPGPWNLPSLNVLAQYTQEVILTASIQPNDATTTPVVQQPGGPEATSVRRCRGCHLHRLHYLTALALINICCNPW